MAAGFAAAEVTVAGDGRMGVQSRNGGDIVFNSRVRIKFSASGETENGLTFGGSVRAEQDGSGSAAGNVNIAGAFGTVTMGDTDSAAKKAVGHAGSVGYTGLDWKTKSPISGMQQQSGHLHAGITPWAVSRCTVRLTILDRTVKRC